MRATVPADRWDTPPRPGDRMLVVDTHHPPWTERAIVTAVELDGDVVHLELDAPDGFTLAVPRTDWRTRVHTEMVDGEAWNVVRNVSTPPQAGLL